MPGLLQLVLLILLLLLLLLLCCLADTAVSAGVAVAAYEELWLFILIELLLADASGP